MITFFTVPKPFRGETAVLQRNAIMSWAVLTPRPEILLIGDEEGTREMAEEVGARFISGVERNEYNTPLVSDIFHIGEREASLPLLCYLNADIILLDDIVEAVGRVKKHFGDRPFFMAGRRWNIDIARTIDFSDPSWQKELRAILKREGGRDRYCTVDYFIFPKGFWGKIPPFALGRNLWDNWLLSKASALGVPFIDASESVTIVHQNHDYSHARFDIVEGKGPEIEHNKRLCRLTGRFGSLLNATHLLVPAGFKKPGFGRIFARWYSRLIISLWYLCTDVFHSLLEPVESIIRRGSARLKR